MSRLNGSTLDVEEQAKQIRLFLQNDFISVRSVDRKTAEEAAEIGRKTGLKGADCVHLATAIRFKCHAFQTYDGASGDSKKPLAFDGKIGNPPLKIELPRIPPTKKQRSLI